MSQIYCPGGQCGVRNHVAGSEAAIACGQLTAMRRAVSGIKAPSISSAPKLSTGAKRSSWQDQGYEGEIVLDPSGCKCSGCNSGASTPISSLSSDQVMHLISGTHAMNNRSASGVKFDVEREEGAVMVRLDNKTWEIDGDDIDEDDMVKEFDRDGNPVY